MNFMADIKEKSSLLHNVAENTGYIKKIFDCEASVDGYGEYISNLQKVYEAIENGLIKNENNSIVKPFVTTELFRSKLIEKDIQALFEVKSNSFSLLP